MATYRAYLLDPAGKITWGEWIEAASQGEAERKAHELCKPGTPVVELWQGPNRLAELPCNDALPTRRTKAAAGRGR
jgi:hypothetical protein